MTSAVEDLDLAHLWVVYPGNKAYSLAEGVSSFPLTDVGDRWSYA
jgi:hypothetical protein